MCDDTEQIFKNLLTKFKNDFDEEFVDNYPYKNVAKLQRISVSLIEKLSNPEKFNGNLKRLSDLLYNDAKDEKTNENTQSLDENNDKILSISNIYRKRRELNNEIREKTIELKVNSEVQENKSANMCPLEQIEDALQKLKTKAE